MPEPHESRVYSDFAHFYDRFFGRAFVDSEHEVIEWLNLRPGQRVLEVGVGTGISLDAYPPYVHVVGIDPSPEMLDHAKTKARENDWRHVELMTGDAQNLPMPADSFDVVCAFHVVTVVPDPEQAMREMIRVCKPGGRVVVINHFRTEKPILGFLVRIANPLTKHLGWTTRLRYRDFIKDVPLTVERCEKASLLHTVMVARKGA
ncbi:MAG TPA: methyltransferase domain-containing protein [Terriglobales bacterium]|jgi:phosphatidylethanolamine/phosphatidyl-N-methylethanolamine N-methyltransferase|nr:methyltransferase domain-containing protein [Terriglobales bacterium]